MNSVNIFFKSLFLKTCILVLVTTISYAQEVPIPPKHLVNQFIERQITLGNLSQGDASVRPLTYSKVRDMLKQVSLVSNELSIMEKMSLKFF